MKNFNPIKFLLFAFLAGAVGAFVALDLGQYLSFDYIKGQQAQFVQYYNDNPLLTIAIYMGIYIASTALSLPGAALLTLLAGALFGVVMGTIIVSFSSTIGATLAFLTARFLLRDWVESKFSKQIAVVNNGVEKEGAFYLFSIRLIPAFPFFMVNLVMGLTRMKIPTYFIVSQIGMLAGTAVYVNAGTQLAQLDSLAGIASPAILGSFIALGLFPIAVKKLMEIYKKKKGTLKNA